MLWQFDVCIGYTPIGDEPDFSIFLKAQGVSADIIRLPATRENDPLVAATELVTAHAGKKVCILIPGRRFDGAGTRHGRGGGWYDRFLSAIPREWLRVGVLNPNQLSTRHLKRESWDEPMDVLLIKEKMDWAVLPVKN